jgi:c-di-GMP-binding flagellar brake protein YcgR
MQDRRKTKRRFLLYYMRIYDATTHQQIGNLVDITLRGAMVVSEHPIPEGQTTRLSMELTDEVADKPFMEFSAQSKWCRPDITLNMHDTGFEILDLAPEDAKIVHRIVEEFGFRDNQPMK